MNLRLSNKFSRDLFVSFLGIGFWSAVIFILNIIAGRLLGPGEYGKYNLSLSIAYILLIPMTLGATTALVKYGAKAGDDEKGPIISTILIAVLFLTIFTAFAAGLILPSFARYLDISGTVVFWSVILAVGISLFDLINGLFRSLNVFNLQARWMTLGAIAAAAVFGGLLIVGRSFNESFTIFAGSIATAYFFVFIGGLWTVLRQYSLKFVFHWEIIKRISRFGIYAVIAGTVGAAMSSIDKLALNFFMGERIVGIYAAYSLTSTVILLKLVEIFVNVFFPKISSVGFEEKAAILGKIAKFSLWFFLPLFLAVSFLSAMVLLVFGSDYGVNLGLIALFGLASTLLSISAIVGWFVASLNIKWTRFTILGICLLAFNAVANLLTVPIWGIYGAVLTTILTYIFYLIYTFNFLFKKFKEAKPTQLSINNR